MIEQDVGQNELHGIPVLATLVERTRRDFVVKALNHDAWRVTVRDDRRALAGEYRVPHVVIAMGLTVDDPPNRRIGYSAYLR